jgi:hypothetical protein
VRTIKCDQPGCDFVAKHDTDYVHCIIGRHKSMRHGIRGKMFKYTKSGKAELAVSGKDLVPEPQPEPVNIPNFCPNCGCSITAIMAAMNLRRKR